MPLPTTSPSQFPALSALATGPFSYLYSRKGGKEILPFTDYPAPDGEWKTCFAEEWPPKLA
jgi:hypothetical protein